MSCDVHTGVGMDSIVSCDVHTGVGMGSVVSCDVHTGVGVGSVVSCDGAHWVWHVVATDTGIQGKY